MDAELRKAAEKEALTQGFSSLQDVVRLFLVQLGKQTVDFTFLSVAQHSRKNEGRCLKIDKHVKLNK